MKKILQFEDDEFLAKMYGVKLKQEGFEHIWQKHPATDKAEDLINYVLEVKPDLILMDIIMPVMNGFEATEILKKDDRTKHIPLFIISNMSQQEDLDKGRELGANEYLVNAHHIPSKIINYIKSCLEDPENYKPIFG